MSIKIIKEKNLSWINIDQVDDESLAYLRGNYNFHHLDLEDVQSEAQSPKIDVYKKYLFIVLQFPLWDATTQAIVPQELDIFIGDNYLITIQHSKNKDMKNFFYRCMKNKKIKRDWMSGNSGNLLHYLADSLFQNSRPVLNNIGRRIGTLEQEIFSEEKHTSPIKALAVHRRNILAFRRILDPQRYLIANLSHIRKPFLDEDLSLYFDNIGDYLNKIWAILDTYKDTIDGLHVTTESLINQRTNKVIGTLTVMSVALLPLTLLSGIYGMNVSNLPFADDPVLVWSIFGVLTSLIVIVIITMRRKGWI